MSHSAYVVVIRQLLRVVFLFHHVGSTGHTLVASVLTHQTVNGPILGKIFTSFEL